MTVNSCDVKVVARDQCLFHAFQLCGGYIRFHNCLLFIFPILTVQLIILLLLLGRAVISKAFRIRS